MVEKVLKNRLDEGPIIEHQVRYVLYLKKVRK